MVTKWLHLNERGGDPWVLPIWAAAHKAIAEKRVPPISANMSELAVHVSARLNVLPRVISRLNEEVPLMLDAVKSFKAEHVFTPDAEGRAISVDDDLKYKLIADIDSLLFEVNSCTELMRSFFSLLHEHVGKPIAPADLTKTLQDLISKGGVSGEWFKLLDRDRNFVTHTGTPYLAVDITNGGASELLVMKENIREFGDPNKYFRFSELRDIVNGFDGANKALQAHLIRLYQP